MQTYLPYPDFELSARCLDTKRLGKQRVEAMQILKALRNADYGWQNHPAVRMWRGCEDALTVYMNACILEWVRRGYRNSMSIVEVPERCPLPAWLGDDAIHSAYRAALLFKDFDYYQQFGWVETPQIAYIWPV